MPPYQISEYKQVILHRKKRIVLIVLMVIIICTICSLLLICNIGQFIDVELVRYFENPDHNFNNMNVSKYYYNASEETAADMKNNPDSYAQYYIEIKINNTNKYNIYNIKVNLLPGSENIWFCKIGLAEWVINLLPGEEYTGDVSIIVKTDDMTKAEIDQLIKSMGIEISYSDTDVYPFKYFRKAQHEYF